MKTIRYQYGLRQSFYFEENIHLWKQSDISMIWGKAFTSKKTFIYENNHISVWSEAKLLLRRKHSSMKTIRYQYGLRQSFYFEENIHLWKQSDISMVWGKAFTSKKTFIHENNQISVLSEAKLLLRRKHSSMKTIIYQYGLRQKLLLQRKHSSMKTIIYQYGLRQKLLLQRKHSSMKTIRYQYGLRQSFYFEENIHLWKQPYISMVWGKAFTSTKTFIYENNQISVWSEAKLLLRRKHSSMKTIRYQYCLRQSFYFEENIHLWKQSYISMVWGKSFYFKENINLWKQSDSSMVWGKAFTFVTEVVIRPSLCFLINDETSIPWNLTARLICQSGIHRNTTQHNKVYVFLAYLECLQSMHNVN